MITTKIVGNKKRGYYVYKTANKYPPFCQIIKGTYLGEDSNSDSFLGFGVITADTWDELGLQEDIVYKDGNNFIVERNICLFPNYNAEWDWDKNTKDAKLVRIQEIVTPEGGYSYEVIKVITNEPPLIQIFHVD
jgi:hypothetical protein